MSQSFNPIKEEINGKKAHAVVWTSESLQVAVEGIRVGKKLVANPFYENNIKLLKGDLVFNMTDEEIAEWQKCKDDIIYFSNTYCKLMTPEGIQNVEMRNYQEDYLRHLEKNRLSIFLSCRQSGKTTTSAIFLLHYILFNFDKNALVLGNKGLTAREILSKLKNIFYELPYFLKPGVYKWNESQIVLDNGCMCMAEATTKNSGISFTFHCVLADEFAHVEPNILDKFYNNLFPTITAAKARFIISSTQNGYNLFYRLYKSAEVHENEYAPFKVDWWQVPEWNPEKNCWEPRDEKWHKLQIANYGSEEAFNQQFGTSFDVSSNTLINPKSLKKFNDRAVEFVNCPMGDVLLDNYYFWHPGFNPLSDFRTSNNRFLITIDLAEGSGGDYTVFNINRITTTDNKPHFECVGFFRCNSADLPMVAKSLRMLCKNYIPMYSYLISVEENMYGPLFMKLIMEEIDDNPYEMELFNEDSFIKYYNESGTKFTNCIKMTHQTKLKACMTMKNDLEHDTFINNSTVFNSELFNFSDQNGNGVYKASYGHDDMVMTEVQVELARETESFKNMLEEMNAQNAFSGPNNDPSTNIYGNIYGTMGGFSNGPEMGFYEDYYGNTGTDPNSYLSRMGQF